MSDFVQLQITFPNRDEAEKIARILVEEKKVACAQIIGPIQSFYRWNGVLENENEFLLFAKTESGRFAEVADFVQAFHSYDCPQIVATPIRQTSESYRRWLDEQLERE